MQWPGPAWPISHFLVGAAAWFSLPLVWFSQVWVCGSASLRRPLPILFPDLAVMCTDGHGGLAF